MKFIEFSGSRSVRFLKAWHIDIVRDQKFLKAKREGRLYGWT